MATEREHYRLWSIGTSNQMVNNHPDLLEITEEKWEAWVKIPRNQHCPHPAGLPTDVSKAGGPAVAHGSSQRSPARNNCTWNFRLQSRKFSGTQRHSGKWAVTKTACVSGWNGNCGRVVSLYLHGTFHSMDKEEKWLPRESKLITFYKVYKLYKKQSSSLTDCKM